MQIKKACFSGWLLAGVVFIVLAVLSVGAVFAYTSKLGFTMPVSFKLQNCTLKYEKDGDANDEIVFSSDSAAVSQNFAVKPVSENTLEISCKYSFFQTMSTSAQEAYEEEYNVVPLKQISISVNENFTLSLTKLTIYNAVAFDESVPELNNSIYVAQSFSSQILTITLHSGLAPETQDDVSFCIKVLPVV